MFGSFVILFSLMSLGWCFWICCCLPNIFSIWTILYFSLCILLCYFYYILSFILFLYLCSRCFFKILFDYFAIDFLNIFLARFEIVISLLSILYNARILIGYYVLDNNLLITLNTIYSNANPFECEIWDLFGLMFIANKSSFYHMFLDFGFKGYPLRKDFQSFGYVSLGYVYCMTALSRYIVYNILIARYFASSVAWYLAK